MLQIKSHQFLFIGTIDRRINKLDIHVNNNKLGGNDVILAIDSTGIKVTYRGEWMRHKWHCKSKKGYLKIHIAVNINNKNNKYKNSISKRYYRKSTYSKLLPILGHDIARKQNIDVNPVITHGSYDKNKDISISFIQ